MASRQADSISIKDLSPEHRAALDAMMDQILVILVAKLGGEVTIPVAVVDHFPVGRGLDMKVDTDGFWFGLIETPNAKPVRLDHVKAAGDASGE